MAGYLRICIMAFLSVTLFLSVAACARKYTTTQGQEITLKEHEALFLYNCEQDKWWDNHSPAANCGFFGKDTLRYDPIGALGYLKMGCDKGDDLSCLEYVSNAYKLSTDDKRYKLFKSYKLPVDELMKARAYAMDLCLAKHLVIGGADNTKWLCHFAGKLHSDVQPADDPKAIKAFKTNCDQRNDCADYNALLANKPKTTD